MFELGNTLRDARIRRGLGFEELERVTKIRAKYLRALENEDFEVLPGPTYVKGFLKTYAERLGLDGQLYVDEFSSRYLLGGDEDVPFRPRRSPRPESRRVGKNAVVLALAAVVILFALALFAFTRPDTPAPIPNLKQAGSGTKVLADDKGVRLIVIAKGSSFLKVESASGLLLFAGTLERNDRQVFHGRRLQLHVSALRNLAFQVGSRVYTTAGSRPGPATVTVSSHGVDIGPP